MSIRSFNNNTPRISNSAYVAEHTQIIGQVNIANDCSIWPFCVIRGDVNKIAIGANTNIQDGSILHVTHDSEYTPGGFALNIGESVTVGHRVTLHGCTIGNSCLIGMGSTIMDGAILENNVLLGACSLVSPDKKLVSGYLYRGSPAKQIRPLTDAELLMLKYSAQHYRKLKDQYLSELKVTA